MWDPAYAATAPGQMHPLASVSHYLPLRTTFATASNLHSRRHGPASSTHTPALPVRPPDHLSQHLPISPRHSPSTHTVKLPTEGTLITISKPFHSSPPAPILTPERTTYHINQRPIHDPPPHPRLHQVIQILRSIQQHLPRPRSRSHKTRSQIRHRARGPPLHINIDVLCAVGVLCEGVGEEGG